MSHFLLNQRSRNLKLAFQIWTSIHYSVANDYYIQKDTWNRINVWCLKKIIQVNVSRHVLPKLKIVLKNLDFHDFSCSKWLIYSERHAKICLYITFKENRYSRFWAIQFRFIDFRKNLKILTIHLSGTVYKMWLFYLH